MVYTPEVQTDSNNNHYSYNHYIGIHILLDNRPKTPEHTYLRSWFDILKLQYSHLMYCLQPIFYWEILQNTQHLP